MAIAEWCEMHGSIIWNQESAIFDRELSMYVAEVSAIREVEPMVVFKPKLFQMFSVYFYQYLFSISMFKSEPTIHFVFPPPISKFSN
jgi:hypothetical protein